MVFLLVVWKYGKTRLKIEALINQATSPPPRPSPGKLVRRSSRATFLFMPGLWWAPPCWSSPACSAPQRRATASQPASGPAPPIWPGLLSTFHFKGKVPRLHWLNFSCIKILSLFWRVIKIYIQWLKYSPFDGAWVTELYFEIVSYCVNGQHCLWNCSFKQKPQILFHRIQFYLLSPLKQKALF